MPRPSGFGSGPIPPRPPPNGLMFPLPPKDGPPPNPPLGLKMPLLGPTRFPLGPPPMNPPLPPGPMSGSPMMRGLWFDGVKNGLPRGYDWTIGCIGACKFGAKPPMKVFFAYFFYSSYCLRFSRLGLSIILKIRCTYAGLMRCLANSEGLSGSITHSSMQVNFDLSPRLKSN